MYNTCELTLTDIKDLISILFWFFTAVLAYKTYKNAKKTLFNPIRSEMVKYQMKVITEFIDNHTSKGLDFHITLDYPKLIIINFEADYLLNIFSDELKFENHNFDESDKKISENLTENLAGLFEVVKKNDTYYFQPFTILNFEIAKQYIKSGKVKEKENENTDLILQRFFTTNKFHKIYSDLLNLQANPFIPEEIKIHVNVIIENIFKNLHILYEIISNNIEKENQGKKYQDIYSEFNLRKINHGEDVNELHKKITKYFKVNKI